MRNKRTQPFSVFPAAVNIYEIHLVDALKDRDKNAFEYLYNHYSSALYSIMLNIIPNASICQDLLQEVFIKIWQKIDYYDRSKGTLFTWMLNISKNHAIDTALSPHYQNQRKHVDSLSVSFISVEGCFFNYENFGLRKVVNLLEKQYRDVIILYFFHGFTDKQISELLNTPIGTIKTRKRKALVLLRKLIV
jgi:RNA polymerase sigma-70 factor (ECF subfamily)